MAPSFEDLLRAEYFVVLFIDMKYKVAMIRHLSLYKRAVSTNKRDEHNVKYSGNKVYQIMILVIGEIES